MIGPLMIGVTFAIAFAGCSSLWQIKPSPAAAPSEASSSGGAAQPATVATEPKDESEVRCEQLARATPGLEEIRIGNDGTIESRQWTLIAHDSAPRWAVVGGKDNTSGGWAPKPGIGKLNFNPPIQPALTKESSQFLAYAPVDVKKYDDLQTMTSLSEVFGAPQGRFQWRGKTYGYALTKRLPCYPPLLQ